MTHAPTAPGRRASRAAVLATLAGVALIAPTAGAHGSNWRSPAISPAEPEAAYLTPAMPAGGRWTGNVEVINTAPVARRVRIYAVDAAVPEGGAFVPTIRAHRHVGRWLVPAVRGLLLEPWERRRIGIRAAVPGQTAAGLYLGAVVVEEIQPSRGTARFRVVPRAGLRVYLKVITPQDAAGRRASVRSEAVSS